MTSSTPLADEFGQIDIYLFDQLLRGRITPDMRVLDAGCGGGRNLVYMLRHGYDVFGADAEPPAIAAVRTLARTLAPTLTEDRFRMEPVERLSFANASMDVVVSSAVLHFARDEDHFLAMVREMWRVLAPGGLFFARLASTIGIAADVRPLGHSRFLLPDGSERYLVDEAQLVRLTSELGGRLLDPLKTTIVQNQRSMTTWVVRKS